RHAAQELLLVHRDSPLRGCDRNARGGEPAHSGGCRHRRRTRSTATVAGHGWAPKECHAVSTAQRRESAGRHGGGQATPREFSNAGARAVIFHPSIAAFGIAPRGGARRPFLPFESTNPMHGGGLELALVLLLAAVIAV